MYSEESGEDEEDEDDDEEGYEVEADFTEEPGNDSGCTAVVALLAGTTLFVANAGDSRWVSCRLAPAAGQLDCLQVCGLQRRPGSRDVLRPQTGGRYRDEEDQERRRESDSGRQSERWPEPEPRYR